ncbi:18615_t:CDS:2, partial [Rhizophagus irregularis]
ETTYKLNISENVEPSDDADDDLFGHIFKKRKIEEKDELSIYLNEEFEKLEPACKLTWLM